ncbi:hypothetical protein [Fluviispira multicolorata]|uniref:LysM domain-containing protein n=1 Tax=Fluviispira multicolorata TaxID=2654512 RepID=A0A833N335_9BACT|nr:hypothetical protein [Fluviispira multicolorata]KAB8033488.1 hypothetical protein GCL57_01940 [Fluviispira multicolorata]
MYITKSSFLTYLSKLILLTFCLAMSFTVYAQEQNYDEYKVQAYDTLIHILKRHSLRPVFGANGSLAETLNLNPVKKKHNGDLIYIGEILKLPKADNWRNANLNKNEKNLENEYAKKDPTKPKTSKKVVTQTENEKIIIKKAKQDDKEPQKTVIRKPIPKKPEETPPVVKKTLEKKPILQKPEEIKSITKKTLTLPAQNQKKSAFIEKENSSKIPQNKSDTFSNGTHEKKPAGEFKPQIQTAITETNTIEQQEKTSDSQTDNNLSPLMSYKNDSESFINYQFFIESLKYCFPMPACKIGFQEPDSKCCKKPKKFFIINESDSL